MEKEIETKFDLPFEIPQEEVMHAIIDAGAAAGCGFKLQDVITRSFQYYDTNSLDIYRRGNTVRRVGGFGPQHRARFRYDFKVGPVVDRYEVSHWSDDTLTPEQIIAQFSLQRFCNRLHESAYAETKHEKLKLERSGAVLEATIDTFDVLHGEKFRELEIELKKGGNTSLLMDISGRVQHALGLRQLSLQKYSRVIQGMPQYKNIIW